MTLSVPNNTAYTYRWFPGDQTTDRIIVSPENTTEYRVEVRDVNTDTLVCQSNPFTVEVKPRFEIKFRQTQLTCSNPDAENNLGRSAKVSASVDSTSMAFEPPFEFEWPDVDLFNVYVDPSGNLSIAKSLQAFKKYKVKVTDNRGCVQYDSIITKAYPNPLAEIHTDPGDTVYIQNPNVTFSFENLTADSIDIFNFWWNLNSQYSITTSDEEPTFTYVEEGEYDVQLAVYESHGCDTTFHKTVKVNPVKLKVPNVFTPNGDGINDYFIISLDDSNSSGGGGNRDGEPQYEHEYDAFEPLNKYYESSELVIFNRWGRIVYQSKDYQNDWDGGNLPDATYFYVLKCRGLKQDVTYQGSVMIFRGSK